MNDLETKILQEFENLYTGIPADGEMICRDIANKMGLDFDYVADVVYINRYGDMDNSDKGEE